jgi:hypothetical protein
MRATLRAALADRRRARPTEATNSFTSRVVWLDCMVLIRAAEVYGKNCHTPPKHRQAASPLRVVSNAKSARAAASRSSSARKRRPAATATNSGLRGDSPPAIRSALTNRTTPASLTRNSLAKVVFPEPFGPATMTHTGWEEGFMQLSASTPSGCASEHSVGPPPDGIVVRGRSHQSPLPLCWVAP